MMLRFLQLRNPLFEFSILLFSWLIALVIMAILLPIEGESSNVVFHMVVILMFIPFILFVVPWFRFFLSFLSFVRFINRK